MTRGGEATRANVVRNARAERDRLARWTTTRDQCWAFVEPLIRAGADVAIVGQACWRWPFSPEIDCLVWAIATRPRGPAPG